MCEWVSPRCTQGVVWCGSDSGSDSGSSSHHKCMMKHHHLEVAVVDRSEIMMPAAVVMVEEGMREDLSSDSRSLRT